MSQVFAKWHVEKLPEDLTDIHISCGPDDEEQWDAYTLDSEGARLTVSTLAKGWEITFTAPSCGLEESADYWLSPCPLGEDETEAADFGINQEEEKA